MPVIYEGSLPEVPMPYVVIGFVVCCCIGIYMRRKERNMRMRLEGRNSRWPSMQQIVEEKEAMFFDQDRRYIQGTHIPHPPQPPPFTVPTSISQEIPLSNASYYDTNEIYDDPPTYFEPASFTSSEPFESPFEFGLPRRRSYTKTTSQGMEVSGEIVVGEGWRRHTRVFGGGVCKACEESERRMTS